MHIFGANGGFSFVAGGGGSHRRALNRGNSENIAIFLRERTDPRRRVIRRALTKRATLRACCCTGRGGWGRGRGRIRNNVTPMAGARAVRVTNSSYKLQFERSPTPRSRVASSIEDQFRRSRCSLQARSRSNERSDCDPEVGTQFGRRRAFAMPRDPRERRR